MAKSQRVPRLTAVSILLMFSALFRLPSLGGEPGKPTAEEAAVETPAQEERTETSREEPLIEPVGPAGSVAVMDVNQAFLGYARFRDKMDALKAELELADAEIKRRAEDLGKLAKNMMELDRGSEDYAAMQAEIVMERAQVEADVLVRKQEFAEQESAIYFETYRELCQVSEDYAQTNGVGLVLRTSHGDLQRHDPAKVLQYINRAIVWYDESIDITTDITDALNEAAADLPPVKTPGGAGPTEQAATTSPARLWFASWTDDPVAKSAQPPPSDSSALSEQSTSERPSAEVSADEPARGEQTTALLDVSLVFKGNDRFTEAIAAMKLGLELADSETKQRLDEITERQKQLEDLAPGSEDYRTMRREIVQERARLKAGVDVRRQELSRRETELYADTYEEMCRVVKQYAPAHGLTLVLRVSSEPPKEQDPAAVLQYVNKSVPWFSESADITSDIIAALNQAPESGPPAQTPDTSDPSDRAGLQRSLELQRVALRAWSREVNRCPFHGKRGHGAQMDRLGVVRELLTDSALSSEL